MGFNLTNEFIDQSFQQLTQISGSQLVNGTGSLIENLTVSASYADYAPVDPAFSGSVSTRLTTNEGNISALEGSVTALNLETGSLETSISANASSISALNSASGSYLISGSATLNVITLNKVDGTNLTLTVDTGSAEFATSASYATYAQNAGAAVTATSASYASNASTADLATLATNATNAVSASYASNASTADSATSASYASNASTADSATSASYAGNADLLDGLDSTEFAILANNNVFSGNQTFNNITVNGTGSFAYISSVTGSAKIIGDAYIILNNDVPAEPYAGIKVVDSGSSFATASLEWDGVNNKWFYRRESGSAYSGGGVMSGPKWLTNDPNDITFPTQYAILRGQGGDHMEDSNITDNDTTVDVSIPMTVTAVTASLGFVGDLTGTATSASYAVTASYLEGGAGGLEAGSGTYSMQSKATLTLDPAVASGRFAIALGDGTLASATGSIAIGFGASGSGALSTAIGVSAEATSTWATAIGQQVTAGGGDYAVALGNNGTNANGAATTALGAGASAGDSNATAVGASANAGGNSAVAVGSTANAAGYEAVALGSRAEAENFGGVAVGGGVKSTGTLSIGIGNSIAAKNFGTIVIGVNSESETNDYGTAIGYNSKVYGLSAIGIGRETYVSASNEGSIAIGRGTITSGANEVLLGSGSLSHGANTVTIGNAQITATYLQGAINNSGLVYPTSDGTPGQALKTDGSGNLTFGDVATGLDVKDNGTSIGTIDTLDFVGDEWTLTESPTGEANISVNGTTGTGVTSVEMTNAVGIVYNTAASPATGNITITTTGAKVGASVIIYHQDATEPTVSGMTVDKKVGSYDTSALNMISFVHLGSNHVLQTIAGADVTGIITNSTDTYTSTAEVQHVITCTAAEYAAIGSPDANTFYIVI